MNLKTVLLAFAPLAHTLVGAAPFTPSSNTEVVERLPASRTDPSVSRVESLRKQLAARPDDVALRADVAQRYFGLAMAQGDPRYVGYALAALGSTPPVGADGRYFLALGQLQQYNHDFAGALASLDRAIAVGPPSPEPFAWRAAIYMVQARYDDARAACERMAPLTSELTAAGCLSYVGAATGQLPQAFDTLQSAVNRAVAARPAPSPELLLWQLTRLAEMAWRLQRTAQAEGYFQQALKLGITDQFLLAAYADFLLQQKRPGQVIALLLDWERSDVLLLRLALAGQAANDARAKGWVAQLKDRFDAAALRGDRLHEQEAARFALDLQTDPQKALALALANYQTQKEPRDAEIVLRSALAAKKPAAAQAALDWLQSSRYQDPLLAGLAAQVTATKP
jgi:tetratricopeptide (TPR) repeat protein